MRLGKEIQKLLRAPRVDVNIQALIFDWGGVIQRTEDWAPRRALDRELGLAPGGVDQAVFESEAWQLASTGRCTSDEAWSQIAAALGIPEREILPFLERFFAGDRRDARLVALIQALRDRGMPVGLLSNAPPPRLSDHSSAGQWGDASLFDVQVFSYQVGTLKPKPKMYRTIVRALRVPPHEALFVDDAPANVQGARDEGLNAVLFSDTDSLLHSLLHMGIRL